MRRAVTALRIGAPPAAKTTGQLAAERRDRRAARSVLVDMVVETATLTTMSTLLVLLLYGSGPFEGAKLLLLG